MVRYICAACNFRFNSENPKECPYCGTELEWSLTVSWDNQLEKPVISGLAYSCGVTFAIRPIGEVWENEYSYYLEEKGKEDNESH